MNTQVGEVYDRLWLRVKERNLLYYKHYPGDVHMVKKIVQYLLSQDDSNPIKLPSGGTLTARRFLQLGLALGGSPGSSFANLHSVVNSAFLDDDDDELSAAFLKRIDYEQSFDDAPLYFLLHESKFYCYICLYLIISNSQISSCLSLFFKVYMLMDLHQERQIGLHISRMSSMCQPTLNLITK